MPLALQDFDFIDQITLSTSKQINEKFKLNLTDLEESISALQDLAKLKAMILYQNKANTQHLTKSNAFLIQRWLEHFLKSQLILLLITQQKSLEIKIPNLDLPHVKQCIKDFFLGEYTKHDKDTGQYILKEFIVNDHVTAFVNAFQTDPTGIYVAQMTSRSSQIEVKKSHEQCDIDFECYDMYFAVKHLGIKIGFMNDFRPKIPVFKKSTKEFLCDIPLVGPSDGLPPGIGYQWMHDLLNNYLNEEKEVVVTPPIRGLLQDISASIQMNATFHKNTNEEKAEENALEPALYKRYLNKNPILIGGSWLGHAIGIGLIGNYLIYCNRGERTAYEKSSEGTLYIYELSKPLEQSKFNLVLQRHKDSTAFSKILASLVPDPKKPLFSLYTKNQKRGNCGFSNIKSLLKAFIFLNIHQSNQNPDAKKRYAESITEATKIYKQLTCYMRLDELRKFANKIGTYAKGSLAKERSLEIFAQILCDHMNNDIEFGNGMAAINRLKEEDKTELQQRLNYLRKGRSRILFTSKPTKSWISNSSSITLNSLNM